jgi:hypothetical protein
MGTYVVGFIVLGVIAAIVARMVAAKRRGKSVMCDCGCESCEAVREAESKK